MQRNLMGAFALAAAMLIVGCNDSNTTKNNTTPAVEQPNTDSPAKTTQAPTPSDNKKPPVMNIVDTVSIKRVVVYMKDSAATTEGLGAKLGAIYADKLTKFLSAAKINPISSPMAWYKSEKAPYFFEAGFAVAKAPAKLAPGVFTKEVPAGNVLVVHFFGPYELLSTGYEAAKARMAEAKLEAAGAPYEVYIGDPEVEKDPYKVLTDIVFPVKPGKSAAN